MEPEGFGAPARRAGGAGTESVSATVPMQSGTGGDLCP